MDSFKLPDRDFTEARRCRKLLIDFFDNLADEKPEAFIPISRKLEEPQLASPNSSGHFNDKVLPLKVELDIDEEVMAGYDDPSTNELSFELQLNSLTDPRVTEEAECENSPPKEATKKYKNLARYKHCTICNKSSMSDACYYKHMLRHQMRSNMRTLKTALECQRCHTICVSNKGLRFHVKTFHGICLSDDELKTSNIDISAGKIKCKECESLISPAMSWNHVKKFHANLLKKPEPQRVDCKECGKNISKKHYRRHLKLHSSKSEHEESDVEGKTKCDECGKWITTRCLSVHKSVHKYKKLGRQFKCKFCDFSRSLKGNVKLHMKSKHKNMSLNATIKQIYVPLQK